MKISYGLLAFAMLVIDVNALSVALSPQSKSRSSSFVVKPNVTYTPTNQVDSLRRTALYSNTQYYREQSKKNETLRMKFAKRADVAINVQPHLIFYAVDVAVGDPSTTYSLLVDTGSSNTWVGALTPYKQSSTSQATGQSLSVTYGSGKVVGKQFTDQLAFANNLVISGQGIGSATKSAGIGQEGADGILGVGPKGLTANSLTPNQIVPTVVDELFSQNMISSPSLGVFFLPSDNVQGQLDFGEVDTSLLSSQLTALTPAKTEPESEFWSAQISMSVDGQTICSNTGGIIDTGTTLLMMASDFFSIYADALANACPGTTLDQTTGLLLVPNSQVSQVPALNIVMNGKNFGLVGEATLFNAQDSISESGQNGFRASIVGNSQSNSQEGLAIIMGKKWLERYYTFYDISSGAVSVGSTAFTNITSDNEINAAIKTLASSNRTLQLETNFSGAMPVKIYFNNILNLLTGLGLMLMIMMI